MSAIDDTSASGDKSAHSQMVLVTMQYPADEPNLTILQGVFEVGKLVALAEFMVGVVDQIAESKIVQLPVIPPPVIESLSAVAIEQPKIQEAPKVISEKQTRPTEPEPKLSEKEAEWRKFRESIKTETGEDGPSSCTGLSDGLTFRDVRWVCLQCGASGSGRMQVADGEHLWDCCNCGMKTTHIVEHLKGNFEIEEKA